MKIEQKRNQSGFTLIELVVVIVILGILAAFAIPRFVDVSTDARTSSVRGVAGSLSSSSALAHGLALARGQTGATGSISMEGQAIALVFGYPAATAAGIELTLSATDGYTITHAAGVSTFVTIPAPATPANCSVTYTQATATTAAAVTLDVTDCS